MNTDKKILAQIKQSGYIFTDDKNRDVAWLMLEGFCRITGRDPIQPIMRVEAANDDMGRPIDLEPYLALTVPTDENGRN